MKRVRLALQLVLGGAVWGSFVGILAGGAAGTVFGMLRGNPALGLDGALLVGLGGCVGGGLYGGVVAWQCRRDATADLERVAGR